MDTVTHDNDNPKSLRVGEMRAFLALNMSTVLRQLSMISARIALQYVPPNTVFGCIRMHSTIGFVPASTLLATGLSTVC